MYNDIVSRSLRSASVVRWFEYLSNFEWWNSDSGIILTIYIQIIIFNDDNGSGRRIITDTSLPFHVLPCTINVAIVLGLIHDNDINKIHYNRQQSWLFLSNFILHYFLVPYYKIIVRWVLHSCTIVCL